MRTLFVFVCLSLLAFTAFAQTDRGTLTGVIADPTGAVVPSAAIEVKNSETGAVFQGGTSTTGNYTFSLPRGTYELSVTVSGFKKFVRQNIEIPVATTVRQDVKLEVGATSDVITISESTPLLKTESGEVSHNVSIERAENLPVLTLNGNIRNPLQLVNLLPGTQFVNDSNLRVNGLPANSEAIRIEGQDASNGLWRATQQIAQSGVDAIQEVQIQTSNYAAEFGQAGGGYFNFTMKSGTNQFHGSAYDYIVNEGLHAGTPFTDAGATNSLKAGQHIRNRQRRNDYGFTFGGPIVIPKIYDGHDKTFFFFNFEQYRQATSSSGSTTTVPTDAYRQGDFSCATLGGAACFGVTALGNLTKSGATALDPLGRVIPQNGIYNPSTTRTLTDGSVVRDLFAPFNVIPPSRLDPVAAKIQAMLPTANTTGLVNNYTIPIYSDYDHHTIPSIKIDHSFSPTIKVSGYFSYNYTFGPNANGFNTQPFTAVTPTDNTSTTTRINYEQTITPTLLLHLGIGFLRTANPAHTPEFDQSSIGLKGFYAKLFPGFSGMSSLTRGGNSIGLGAGVYGAQDLFDNKPTANASLTWVKNNHTYKLGGELVIENFPMVGLNSSNGIFSVSATQTSLPWENGQSLNSSTGFAYASFFLGAINSMRVSPPAQTSLGMHGIGMFIQDTWKVTRNLTLDYGLRYDYQSLLKEQYGRMQNMSWSTPNPTIGGRLGAVIYEGDGGGRCNCRFQSNYPYAIGPRLGMAYQINSKTVFRGGAGLSYGTTANNAYLSYSVPDFYTINAPGYGYDVFPGGLQDGNPYRPGNPYGFAPFVFPDFSPGKTPIRTVAGLPPVNSFISIDRNAGRPPRIFSWSIGLQREVRRDLVVEAAYVANRGAWFTAPVLAVMNFNGLQPAELKSRYGIDISSETDRTLLTTPIGNATTGVISPALTARGLGSLPYKDFPLGQTLIQALRPLPQFTGIPPFLGPPLGDTWYDSLQAKVTKRYSHGLDLQGAFTWQKELSLGTNSDTSYLTLLPPTTNDIYNRASNKQVSVLSRPIQLVISGNYITPRWRREGMAFKMVSQIARDWQLGAVLRYQSGVPLHVPNSLNNLPQQLGRGPQCNPCTFGGGVTYWNQVPGVPLFLNGKDGKPIDPNCGCFDPTRDLVLNPAAWTDAPAGQWGVSAPYYNNYRWQRQPSEALSLARIFRMGPEGKYSLQVRAEFQNVFNRVFFSAPSTSNPSATVTRNGVVTTNGYVNQFTSNALTAGYGFVSTIGGAGTSSRRGQAVIKFSF